MSGRNDITSYSPTPYSPTGRSLTDAVWERALARPHEPALVELRDGGADLVLDRQELVDRADRTAAVLAWLGVGTGDTVVVQLPNSADFVTVSLAALRLGAMVCPVLPSLREHEIAHVLRRSGARVLVVPRAFRRRDRVAEVAAMAAAGRTGALRHLVVTRGTPPDTHPLVGTAGPGGPYESSVAVHDLARSVALAEPLSSTARPVALPARHVAHLLFTSGTTGEPKGVPHRMDTLDRAATLAADRLGLTAADRVHIAAPMAHHSGFLYGMWLSLLLGAVQIVQPVWEAGRALRAFDDWHGTFMQGSTPFLLDMVDAVDAGAPVPKSLRTFVITGASVPRAVAERARSTLGVQVCAAWGSTETCMATLSAPGDDPASVAATDGRPLDGVRLRVTDDAGAALGTGREGHLEMTGPCVFDGYLEDGCPGDGCPQDNCPEPHPVAQRDGLTAEAFTDDGWYRTGDLAVLERTGFLRITGRAKDVINRGGEKIPAGLVEQLMATHPAVREAAVVGLPDPRLGERACLFAVVRPGAELGLSDVQEHLDSHRVTKHYWPERLEIVDALPRNPAGKVQKFLLRERT
ncbi:AMP-binding protein [Streptomyces sp. NPDC021093]|uniref:AMP-binding protein n=1 Tax=Streptomyces sp. NPDC021093 TaxID=3365112 RepID=UPI00379E3166